MPCQADFSSFSSKNYALTDFPGLIAALTDAITRYVLSAGLSMSTTGARCVEFAGCPHRHTIEQNSTVSDSLVVTRESMGEVTVEIHRCRAYREFGYPACSAFASSCSLRFFKRAFKLTVSLCRKCSRECLAASPVDCSKAREASVA
jgi:hypothetical protein